MQTETSYLGLRLEHPFIAGFGATVNIAGEPPAHSFDGMRSVGTTRRRRQCGAWTASTRRDRCTAAVDYADRAARRAGLADRRHPQHGADPPHALTIRRLV
jgi:hypothetical protein